jgi:hypothetical protein
MPESDDGGTVGPPPKRQPTHGSPHGAHVHTPTPGETSPGLNPPAPVSGAIPAVDLSAQPGFQPPSTLQRGSTQSIPRPTPSSTLKRTVPISKLSGTGWAAVSDSIPTTGRQVPQPIVLKKAGPLDPLRKVFAPLSSQGYNYQYVAPGGRGEGIRPLLSYTAPSRGRPEIKIYGSPRSLPEVGPAPAARLGPDFFKAPNSVAQPLQIDLNVSASLPSSADSSQDHSPLTPSSFSDQGAKPKTKTHAERRLSAYSCPSGPSSGEEQQVTSTSKDSSPATKPAVPNATLDRPVRATQPSSKPVLAPLAISVSPASSSDNPRSLPVTPAIPDTVPTDNSTPTGRGFEKLADLPGDEKSKQSFQVLMTCWRIALAGDQSNPRIRISVAHLQEQIAAFGAPVSIVSLSRKLPFQAEPHLQLLLALS